MKLCEWDELPENMRTEDVRPYYDALKNKTFSLILKRLFDIFAGAVLLVLLSPLFLIVAMSISLDSKGGIFYRQVRITRYGRAFRMYKFRTMIPNADQTGLLTTNNDSRVTKVGGFLRKTRLDEIPQLINILSGDMTFVGARPEVAKYVECYSGEMMATLLLPAGVTSEASVMYKDEQKLLDGAQNADEIYITKIMPDKMAYNLNSIKNFSILCELKTIFKTVFAVLGK